MINDLFKLNTTFDMYSYMIVYETFRDLFVADINV